MPCPHAPKPTLAEQDEYLRVIFPTIQFAAFFVVVLTASWLLMPHPSRWKPFMVAASYVFYGYADWRFVLLLAASTVINQAAATVIDRSTDAGVRKVALVSAVSLDLGLLGVFKYLDFLIDSVDRVLRSVGLGAPLPLLQVALPVGISFFTFQAISYVVDVYQGDAERASSIDVAVYLAFFPHLVAGPIVRAREFIPQLARPRDPRAIPAGLALFLIAGGLVKKIVIADLLATRIVDPVFGSPEAHSALEVLVAVYGYAVQIYCDFSGYTDMAIGLALLLGFRFPQNFDRPYAATSLAEFWRRWHMTLSRWLRDYLYIPLGGNRGGTRRTYRNLMITMVLGGLWHGAAWTFVVWGAIHGGGLAAERWWRERDGEAAAPPALPRVLAWVVTFHVVCLAWVFFRSPDLGVAFAVLGRLTHLGAAPLVTPTVLLAIAAGMGVQLVRPGFSLRAQEHLAALPVWAQGVTLGALIVVVNAAVGHQGVAPFLYFRF